MTRSLEHGDDAASLTTRHRGSTSRSRRVTNASFSNGDETRCVRLDDLLDSVMFRDVAGNARGATSSKSSIRAFASMLNVYGNVTTNACYETCRRPSCRNRSIMT